VEMELYVNKDTASQLNSGTERLDDILVLHLEGGKDLFVSLFTLMLVLFLCSKGPKSRPHFDSGDGVLGEVQ